MHGGFENETPNIPTNTIMQLELAQLLSSVPVLAAKLEQSIGSANKRAKTSPAGSTQGTTVNTEGGIQNRSQTPPMQSLAKENMKIRIDRAEVEQKPGGKTVMVPLAKFDEGSKAGATGPG